MTEAAAYHQMHRAAAPPPSDCPVEHSFSPFSEAYIADPYAVLAALRADRPVYYAPELGYLVLTRMADVAEVFRRPDDFASANVQDPVQPLCEEAAAILADPEYGPIAVLSNRAPPDHTRTRKHTLAGFSGRRMRLLAPYIRRRCEVLVDVMLAGDVPAEFIAALGFPLPGETIFRLIGFPPEDDARLKRYTSSRLTFTWGLASPAEQVAIARNVIAYWRYCVDFVALRLREPADDFTSELLAAHVANPEDLALREVQSIVYGLTVAGHEIVTHFLANSLIVLLSERERWEALRQDASLLANALEEVLRVNSPQTSWRRIATRDVEVAGVEVPAGTQIFLSLASANHDEALFEAPTDVDLGRENARQHISFGRGIHFCVGNRLATMEATIAIKTLLERVPDFALVPDQGFAGEPNFTFRGPRELWLTWPH